MNVVHLGECARAESMERIIAGAVVARTEGYSSAVGGFLAEPVWACVRGFDVPAGAAYRAGKRSHPGEIFRITDGFGGFPDHDTSTRPPNSFSQVRQNGQLRRLHIIELRFGT